MHFNFNFTTVQVIWTLTLAAHLVLLIVLLGRDRTRRFFWFTTSIALITLRLIASRLLFNRLPQLTLGEIFVILGAIITAVAFLVLIEIARRVFAGARNALWTAWSLVMLAIGGAVLTLWGHWPAWKTIAPHSLVAWLTLLQLAAQKGGLLVDVLTVLLGVLVVFLGRRYGAGWRSHAQRIMIGLSTASFAQLSLQILWQLIAQSAKPTSRDEYERIMGLRDKLFNADSIVVLVVVLWWIVCLWMDEPGRAEPAEVAVPVGVDNPARAMSAVVEPPKETAE